MANTLVPVVRTLITLQEYVRAVVRAWHFASDEPCSREAVAVLWAQYIIETGGKHCYGWNLGNVKHATGDGYDYHCLHGVWEGVSIAEADRLVTTGEALPDLSADHQTAVGANRRSVIFQPPHPATRFRSYPSLDVAMSHHLVLLAKKRYASAWPAVLAGDYKGFANALAARGYFTASPIAYAAGMRRPFDEARASPAFEEERQAHQALKEAPTIPDRLPSFAELAAGHQDAYWPTKPSSEENWASVGDWLVAPEYIAPVGIGEAIQLAAERGCVLPSPELVDEIWAAADLRLEPNPRTFKSWTTAEMNSSNVIEDQARRVTEAIAGRAYRLLAGTHKDVVMTKAGRIGIYGWHRTNGVVIQSFYAGHSLTWKDYSQGLRLVRQAG